MFNYNNIIWLLPPQLSRGWEYKQQSTLAQIGFASEKIHFTKITEGMWKRKPKTKDKWYADPEQKQIFISRLEALGPDFIVVQDQAALSYLTGYQSLATCRGGMYTWNGIPVYVIDAISSVQFKAHGSFTFNNDVQKLVRILSNRKVPQPDFTWELVQNREQLDEFKSWADNAVLISIDIETSKRMISCIGYTIMHKDGKCHSFVIPFINSIRADGIYWDEEADEIYAWEAVQYVHRNAAPKVLQNGLSYDAAYLIKFQIPLNNYYTDTQHLMRSIWIEAPKRLDYIASIMMDEYTYWKDEIREDKDENDGKNGNMPKTNSGLLSYWRYNAKDCYNTLCSTFKLLAIMQMDGNKWALVNYKSEYYTQAKPMLYMSMQGLKTNKRMQYHLARKWKHEAEIAQKNLLTIVGDDNFNPRSGPQYQALLYDILGLVPYRKKRSTDEKVLKLIMDQHPLANRVINAVWDAKKPANNLSKYGNMETMNDRYLFTISVSKTTTTRANSREHAFWLGTNAQNIDKNTRVMFEADEGYVLWDIDYSQSDAYFTAFESEDPKFIETMLSPADTHCIHAAHFFKKSYDDIYRGHKEKADWVEHPTQGVRQNTKRIVYGANYMMQGATLFQTMGRDAVIGSAVALGFHDAYKWDDKKLIKLCTAFLKSYFDMYPGLLEHQRSEVEKAYKNGNKASCAYGYTRLFFGALSEGKTQRELMSFFGQGGTAQNINHAMVDLFYGTSDGKCLLKEGVMILLQVHDSLIGQVPKDKLFLIPEIQKVMEKEITIKNRKFVVPTEAEVGLGWGKRLMAYRNDLTYEEICTHDAAFMKKFFGG